LSLDKATGAVCRTAPVLLRLPENKMAAGYGCFQVAFALISGYLKNELPIKPLHTLTWG